MKKIIICLLFCVLLVNLVSATWWNESWGNYKEIKVEEKSGVTLSNYQTFINVTYDSDMNTSFKDLRFIAADNTTQLDYFIEVNMTVASNYAGVWVKIPTLTASSNTTIYMYYNNPTATSNSNMNTVFLLYDDFEDNSLNTSKWTVVSGCAATESGGNLSLTYSGTGWKSCYTTNVYNFTAGKNIFEYYVIYASPVSNSNKHWGIHLINSTTPNAPNYHYWWYIFASYCNGDAWHMPYASSTNCYLQNPFLVPQKVGNYPINSTYGQLILDGTLRITATGTVVQIGNSYVHLTSWGANAIKIQFDWMRVRAYASVEPKIYFGVEQSAPPVDTCTCAGLNTNWEIDMSDNCNITEACDLTTGTLSFTGAGWCNCNASVDTTNLGDPGASGILYIQDSCLITID